MEAATTASYRSSLTSRLALLGDELNGLKKSRFSLLYLSSWSYREWWSEANTMGSSVIAAATAISNEFFLSGTKPS